VHCQTESQEQGSNPCLRPPNRRVNMIWKGKQIKTYGDLAKAMKNIEDKVEGDK